MRIVLIYAENRPRVWHSGKSSSSIMPTSLKVVIRVVAPTFPYLCSLGVKCLGSSMMAWVVPIDWLQQPMGCGVSESTSETLFLAFKKIYAERSSEVIWWNSCLTSQLYDTRALDQIRWKLVLLLWVMMLYEDIDCYGSNVWMKIINSLSLGFY